MHYAVRDISKHDFCPLCDHHWNYHYGELGSCRKCIGHLCGLVEDQAAGSCGLVLDEEDLMRLSWHIRLPGPFSLSGTIWRSKPKHKGYVRKWAILDCGHAHRSSEAYQACVKKQVRA